MTHGFEPFTDAIEQVVEVRFVFLIIKFSAKLAKMVGLSVAVRLKNITRLEENLIIIGQLIFWKDKRRKTNLANVKVGSFEPFSESWITAAIIYEDVGGVEDNVHRDAVGEAFEKSAQLINGKVKIRVLGE